MAYFVLLHVTKKTQNIQKMFIKVISVAGSPQGDPTRKKISTCIFIYLSISFMAIEDLKHLVAFHKAMSLNVYPKCTVSNLFKTHLNLSNP